MFYHAYDPATGELLEVSIDASQEWLDMQEGAGRTVAQSEDYAAPLTHNYLGGVLTAKVAVALTPDKSSIKPDGISEAVVSVAVEGESPPASIEVLVGGQSEEVALVAGQGSVSPITALTPCTVVVEVADPVTYRADPVSVEASNG